MDMTATTEILRNPAALHSLKKDQLLRLCKEHGVKPGGTKADMVERLAALAASGSGTTNNWEGEPVQREIIHLGSIKEESGSDFGSMKSSMSLKSFVSSLGFSRSKSTSSSMSSLSKVATDMLVDEPEPPMKEALIPLPPSPLIEPFTPPPNVDAGNTIRLVQIPTYTPGGDTTPTRPATTNSYGATPYLPAFRTSFDLVIEGGVGTPARDVARMLQTINQGTPSKTPAGMRAFGTPASRGWSFRPSFAGDDDAPPVPPLPKLDFGLKDGKAEDDEEDDAMDGVEESQSDVRRGPRPSIRTSVMEEMMQRAGTISLDRETRPLPRRSLAGGKGISPPKTEITARFDKAHAEMEAKMVPINEARGTLKKRKLEEGRSSAERDNDDGEGRRKSARVGSKGSAVHPRVSGVGARPRPSRVSGRPSVGGARRQSGRVSIGGRRQSRLQPPVQAKKGLFGFVKGLFGGGSKGKQTDPKPTAADKSKPKDGKGVQVQVKTETQKKVDTAKKPTVSTARKVTPTSTGAMGPPKFVPTKGASKTGDASTTRGNSSVRGSISSTAKGSTTATTRGSITSTTRGSITSTTRGSITSSTRGSISRSSTATGARKVTPTGIPSSSSKPVTTTKPSLTSSRLMQPTKSSIARRSSAQQHQPQASSSALTPAPTPTRNNVTETPTPQAAPTPSPSTPPPTPGIFRMALTPATLNVRVVDEGGVTSPSRIPVPTAGSKAKPRGGMLRSSSTRRPRISRTTVVARLAERRVEAGGSSSSAAKPEPSRKSLAPAPAGRNSLAPKGGAAGRGRRVRSSVGTAAGGKAGILGRRSVGGPAARR